MKQTWKKTLYWLNSGIIGLSRFTFGKAAFAIVLVAILHNLIYLPLKIRSAHQTKYNLKKMKELQPAINAIEEKYRREPGQKLMANQASQKGNEIKRLYQEAGVSFSPGCISIALPIISGGILSQAVTTIKGDERFTDGGILWFKDLTQPDRYYVLTASTLLVSFLKNKLEVSIFSELEKPHIARLRRMKAFMHWSPLLTFGLVLITRRQQSSSLVLYQLTSSGLELAEDYFIKKLLTDGD